MTRIIDLSVQHKGHPHRCPVNYFPSARFPIFSLAYPERAYATSWSGI